VPRMHHAGIETESFALSHAYSFRIRGTVVVE